MHGFEPISGEMIAGAGWPITFYFQSSLTSSTLAPRLSRSTAKPLLASTTPAMTLSRSIAAVRQASTSPVATAYFVLSRLFQVTTSPFPGLIWRVTQILRGVANRSVSLSGDSTVTRTTLGGGPTRTDLEGGT